MERLEQVSGRIAAGITRIRGQNSNRRIRIFLDSGDHSLTYGKLIAPLNRAHRILLGTRIRALEHVLERIAAEIT